MSTGQTKRVTTSGGYLGAPIITGEAVALDLRPAGVATRALAVAIDLVAQATLLFVASLLLFRFALSANSAAYAAISLALTVLVLLGYPVLFETLTRGRTPGKMALGLRVVRDDGGPIRFRHALVRGLIGVVLEKPGFSFGAIAVITMLASRNGKRVGDMAAGTVVLLERVPVRVAPPPPMPPALAMWASGLDLSGVGDELALRARQFLTRAPEFDPAVRDRIGAELVAEVGLRTSAPIPPGVPGWAYLSAVLAERRNREMSRVAPAPAPVPPSPTAPAPYAPAWEMPRPPGDGFAPPG